MQLKRKILIKNKNSFRLVCKFTTFFSSILHFIQKTNFSKQCTQQTLLVAYINQSLFLKKNGEGNIPNVCI